MISPDQIIDKASRLFDTAITEWLAGKASRMFPYRIPCDLKRLADHTKTKNDVRSLRSSSKEAIGYGYRLEETEISSRTTGRDSYPTGVYIDSIDDLMRLIRRDEDFKTLTTNVELVRRRLPSLDGWLLQGWKKLLPRHEVVSELVAVAEWMMNNPRPGIHKREVPLPISTKLIECHESLLSKWFDLLLPSDAIESGFDPQDFNKRYGFREYKTKIEVRVYDRQLMEELRFPCNELMMPIEDLRELKTTNIRVVISENKACLDTIPRLPRTLVIGALGNAIQMIGCTQWLQDAETYYWGDCDVAGFAILNRLRQWLPRIRSVMMDSKTLQTFREITIADETKQVYVSDRLNDEERKVLSLLVKERRRLEHDKLPAAYVHSAFAEMFCTDQTTETPSIF